jgi:polyisoprenoid-binding protein YceI
MRNLRRAVVSVVALLLLGGAAGYWFLLRDTSAPPLTLESDPIAATAPATNLTGSWEVRPGVGQEATTAGYRVQEKLAGGIAKTTATGRTSAVEGSVEVVGAKVTAATFTVDTTNLESDKSARDAVLRTVGLETDEFPTATFTLIEPLVLPKITPGQVTTVKARGELTLHGVTRPVLLKVKFKLSGRAVVVQTALPIAMADYAIDPPSVAGIVSVDDHGSLELLVSLHRSTAATNPRR